MKCAIVASSGHRAVDCPCSRNGWKITVCMVLGSNASLARGLRVRHRSCKLWNEKPMRSSACCQRHPHAIGGAACMLVRVSSRRRRGDRTVAASSQRQRPTGCCWKPHSKLQHSSKKPQPLARAAPRAASQLALRAGRAATSRSVPRAPSPPPPSPPGADRHSAPLLACCRWEAASHQPVSQSRCRAGGARQPARRNRTSAWRPQL